MSGTTLGDRLKSILKERGKSQTWLSEKTGIDRSEINRIINGRKAPRGEHLRWMATALGMDITEMVGEATLPDATAKEAARLQSLMEQKLLAESERDIALARVKSLEAQLESETRKRLDVEEQLETAQSDQAETTALNINLRNHLDRLKETRRRLTTYVEVLKQQRDNYQAALDEARSWIQRLSADRSASEGWNTFLGGIDRLFNTSFAANAQEGGEGVNGDEAEVDEAVGA